MAPYVARLRLTLVEDADPAQLWSAHQEAIARSDGTPVPHRTITQAQALWRSCFLHDARIEQRVGPASTVALYGVLMVGLVLITLLVLVGLPWWAAVTSVAAAAIALVLDYRLRWWLRYSRWLRPRFRARAG
jgi:hypothetical protein